MNLVPKSLIGFGHRTVLKLNNASPTLLVVGGTVGLLGTAVLAARATRQIDPIIEEHQKERFAHDQIVYSSKKAEQKALLHLYTRSATRMTKLYAPTVIVGVGSTVAVLGGHKILRTRQVATMAAYSGLLEQFGFYRKRVAQTLGDDMERAIYEGAHGEWVEGERKGEYSLQPKYDEKNVPLNAFDQPWFDEKCPNWQPSAETNYSFLKGVQAHHNRLLEIRKHVFLNEIYDALKLPRTQEGSVSGWIRGEGDQYIDFGFMTGDDPNTVAFREGATDVVRLNFNHQGPIWNRI